MKRKDHPNVHFVWYEDMKSDHRSALESLARFLGKPIESEERMQTLLVNNMTNKARKNGNTALGKETHGTIFDLVPIISWCTLPHQILISHFTTKFMIDWQMATKYFKE